ncbi:centrosomal protein of 164 kDa isoform X2 [Pangasianodon hypophthalmus]|uniref:centrosomal protein of 164 kDa isoform X2 n=1 Tax=Pangasianodon hypophthalmus TaxID=310915 RepID=UPI002307E71F|nr:centrosomal protein of 164 kDa isoform X2 [Pangasianodon hypophthalmus]
MSASALRIGDQLILEEDYDETYIPSEQEIHEYAREIGIDPEREPELLWLAREGIVAPLPAEWKPCQDVTGDVYYFNFSTGQSTWDHPCDEEYRHLVAQERERSSGSAPVRRDKEKKKKKEKKEKKKEKKKSEPEGPKAPGPLGPLAPLRSVCDAPVPALRGSLGSSSGLQPLKTPLGGSLSGMSSGLQRVRQEERPSLAPPTFYSDEEDDEEEEEREKISMPQSPCGTSRLLQNLHLDLDALGGGLQYEDSEVSGTAPAEERTEPELQDLALSGEISANPPSPSQDSLRGRRLSPRQQGGSGDCSSADVFPPSRQDESIADDELIPVEEEGEERTRDEKRSEEEEQVEAEGQSERDEEEEEEGKRQREESGSEVIEQMERETNSGVETQKARDEMEERKTPDSDKIMERYIDQVEYSGEEEEESGRDEEEEERECNLQNEAVEETEEREDSDGVGEEKEEVERCIRSAEEQRDEADECRSEGEGKASLKHPEEDEENDKESKVTKMSESEDEVSERLESLKENADTPLRQKGMLGKKLLTRCDRLPSEESEVSEHVEVVSSHSDDMKVFRSKFSENILDVTDLCLAEPSAAPEKEMYGGREEYDDDYEKEEEMRGEAAKSRRLKNLGLDEWLSERTQEPPSSSSVSKREDVERERRAMDEEEEKKWKDEAEDRTKREQKEREEEERRRHEDKQRMMREEEEETRRQMEQERLRAVEERDRRLRLLREELRREEEEEERRIKEENEERIRALKERLQRERREEEERMDQETQTKLQHLREQALRDNETHLRTLREENEVRVRELRAELEVERERLEEQRRRDLDKMRVESEEELKAEKKRLQERREEQLASLRLEETTSERQRDLRSPRPHEQLLEYKRELSDVLQEVREEVQREHSRKLEQLKEEHRHQLQAIRETHLEEESNQRERMMSALQEEREQLLTSHTSQLEQLRLQLDTQLHNMRKTHTQKEAEVQGLIEKLELKTKELKIQESRLLAQVADLKKRRKQLDEEEDEVERGLETLPRLLKERDRLRADLERSREESDRLREEMDREREERMREREEMERERKERKREREEYGNMKEERERLQSKVELLQDKCDQLIRRVRELEQRESADCEEEEKKEGEREEERRNREREETLRVEDLEPSPSLDTHSNMQELREFISSESVSLQRARRFLDRQNGNLRERQAMLRAARTTLQDPAPAGVAHLLPQNLQQEASHLEELKETVQKGHTLLRKKEERLSQLENSLVEELSCDDEERMEAERRVTFDVTDSEMSSVYGQEGTVPVKVQQLAESLQQISSQLNTVLGALGPLTQRTSPSFPRASSLPPAPSWAWSPNTASSSTANQNGFTHGSVNGVATLRGSDLLPNSSWRKLLPGVSMDTSTSFSTRAHTAYSGYMPTSLSSMMRSKSSELDSMRLQGLIEGNKRWLETRRKDTNVPLFTRYQAPPSTNGLVQLSLDENNQIRVHHY